MLTADWNLLHHVARCHQQIVSVKFGQTVNSIQQFYRYLGKFFKAQQFNWIGCVVNYNVVWFVNIHNNRKTTKVYLGEEWLPAAGVWWWHTAPRPTAAEHCGGNRHQTPALAHTAIPRWSATRHINNSCIKQIHSNCLILFQIWNYKNWEKVAWILH